VPINAYGFAATFKLREFLPLFETAGPAVIYKDRIVVRVQPGRFVLAYDFGAVVFVGVDATEQKRVMQAVNDKLGKTEPHPPLTEDFVVEVRAVGEVEARFARVVVPQL